MRLHTVLSPSTHQMQVISLAVGLSLWCLGGQLLTGYLARC